MANINALPIEYFGSFASEIQSKLHRLSKIVKHPTTQGDYHEEIIRVVLRNFLPKRFSVKKGFVYKGPEQVSKQIDLMVVDENSPAAYVFQEGSFAIVLPQAVVAVMEIKTNLNANDFDKGLENIASAKSLMELPGALTSILFGFDGTQPSNDNLDVWFKRPTPSRFMNQKAHTPNAVVFFTASTLLLSLDQQNKLSSSGEYHRVEFEDREKLVDFQLSLILAMIINACEDKESRATHYFSEKQGFRLTQLERSNIDPTKFSFGAGKSL